MSTVILPEAEACATGFLHSGHSPSVDNDDGAKYFAHGSHHGILSHPFYVLEASEVLNQTQKLHE
ncbi:unannotated protein [freshwater metagenome]|uniref:Unannotated protein n=1 Tax=freshwater metagenome TaxID=449393 RepID=A0A6J6AH63_9ZZZZ